MNSCRILPAMRTLAILTISLLRCFLRSMLCKRVGWSMPWERGEAQKRWPKAFFAEQGLFSLEAAHAQFVHAHRRAD